MSTPVEAGSPGLFERVGRAVRIAYYEWLAETDSMTISPALHALFGLDPQTWTRRIHLELMHPDDVPGYRAAMAAMSKSTADGGETVYRIKVPSGAWLWARDQTYAERDATGRITRLTGAVSDITDAMMRDAENRALIARQAASIEVLRAISGSPNDAQPVFELIARHARDLCGARAAVVCVYDGALIHVRAIAGVDPGATEQFRAAFPRPPGQETIVGRVVRNGHLVHITDVSGDADIFQPDRAFGARSYFGVPLLHNGRVAGALALGRVEAGGFGDADIALLESFAEQASLAIASAATLRELRERTEELAERNSEFGERIEQQAATIDVLKVMSSTPDDVQPVFDQIVRRAKELCNGVGTQLFEYDGQLVHLRAMASTTPWAVAAAPFPMPPSRDYFSTRSILDGRIIHIRNTDDEPDHHPAIRNYTRKSLLSIPLMRDGTVLGAISLSAAEAGGFSDSQVALLQTFAEQAVIAITSVANFRALRERTAELTRSVAELQALEEVLRAVNSSLDLDTVLATIISRAVRLSDADEGTIYEFDDTEEVFVPKSAHGMTEERVNQLRDRRIHIGETPLGNSAAMRAPLHIPDLRQTLEESGANELLEAGINALLAVPLLRDEKVVGGLVIRRRKVGGFGPTTVTLLQTFAGQCVLAIENARLFQELAARGEEARRARISAEAMLTDLRRAQDRLVQSEKMASLGQLTAGIAHEIKNPLNFVNNFSDLSVDLLDELHEAVAPANLPMRAELRAEIDEITATLKGNLERIAQHGRRADSIVRNMLLHSRTGPSEHRMMDVNATVEEALNLAYHGARAENPGFNIALERDFDPRAGTIEAFPQEFIRVMLNLIGNGFHAAREQMEQTADAGFAPSLSVTTRDLGARVEIRVRDNGTGIPEAVREKIFEPFFTTKPAGEGTGLGLSLSYDIVVKQHNGQLAVDSDVGKFAEFTVTLPRRMTDSGKNPL